MKFGKIRSFLQFDIATEGPLREPIAKPDAHHGHKSRFQKISEI
jgi:hypothetical protein